MKTFDNISVGSLIARVEGYKVECAKVIFKERIAKDELKIVVKGIETKKKYSLDIRGNNYSMLKLAQSCHLCFINFLLHPATTF